MKKVLSVFILIAVIPAYSETKGSFELRAFIPLTAKTSISQFNVSNKQSLLILSNQVNSEFMQETQKVEVEGIDQSKIQAHLEKIVTNNRTIQYHVLINRLKASAENDNPIFVKISAN